MYDELLRGTSESLINAIKNSLIFIFAVLLGILYLMVCLVDTIICRMSYYYKFKIGSDKNRFSKASKFKSIKN